MMVFDSLDVDSRENSQEARVSQTLEQLHRLWMSPRWGRTAGLIRVHVRWGTRGPVRGDLS